MRHLRRVDPVMGRIVDRVGPCTLGPRRGYFEALCQAIFSQQVSGTVADILFARFRKLLGGRPTPAGVLGLTEEQLTAVGLSRQKRRYVRDLAEHFASGRIPVRRLRRMGDEEIIESLVEVKGVGRWTAEMFLIFVLNRPDLLPVDDLGVRKGVQMGYGLGELPSPTQVIAIGEPWRPWRTVATWYLWRWGAAEEAGR